MHQRLTWILTVVLAVFFVSCSGKKPSITVTQYTNHAYVAGITPLNEHVYCATKGGLVKWDLADSSYVVFTTLDGLPSNILTDIIVDEDGKLWIGTKNGVSVSDGTTFTNYDMKDGLPSVEINGLAKDSNGVIWIATGAGVVSYERGHFKLLDDKKGPGERSALCIFFDDGKNIWITTDNDGLYYKIENKWKHDHIKNSYFVSNHFTYVGQSPDGAIWAGSWMGSARWTGMDWEKVPLGNFMDTFDVRDFSSTEETIWFFTNKGVHSHKGSEWARISESEGLHTNATTCAYVESDDKMYVGTEDGMSVIEGRSIKNYLVNNNNPRGYNFVSVKVDNSEKVWSGTWENGIHLYDSGKWTEVLGPDNKSLPVVRSILSGVDNKMIFNTMDGIIFKDGDGWLIQKRIDGVSGDDVRCGVFDNNGRYWAATVGGICYYDNGRWKRYREMNGLPSADTWCCGLDNDGTVWFGTTKGIVSFTGDVLTDRTPETGLKEIDIRSIAVHGDRILFGANDGKLIEYDGKSWEVYGKNYLGTDSAINVIVFDPSGAVWFGTNGDGIIYRKNGEKGRYTYMDGLPSNYIHSLGYGDGVLWAACYGGVAKIEIENGEND